MTAWWIATAVVGGIVFLAGLVFGIPAYLSQFDKRGNPLMDEVADGPVIVFAIWMILGVPFVLPLATLAITFGSGPGR